MRKLIISLKIIFLLALVNMISPDLIAIWDLGSDLSNFTESVTIAQVVVHLVAWGDNSHNECRVSDGRDFVAIAESILKSRTKAILKGYIGPYQEARR